VSKSKKQDSAQSEYHGKDELIVSENSLPRYNRFIVNNFFRFSNLKPGKLDDNNEYRTLDFGAGFGALALIWREETRQSVECLEIDPEQLKVIKSRGFIGWNSLSAIEGKFDFIYSSNVLEHIENDVACLKELEVLLKKGGRIGIYVPAFMILFSDLDRSVGHYRRYGKRNLIEKMENAGFTILKCQYVDSLGFFASFLIKAFGWKATGNIGSSKSIKLYDSLVFPISRLIDRITLGKIFGKNLLLVAEK
jgi:SAM-dependent methyltransferase